MVQIGLKHRCASFHGNFLNCGSDRLETGFTVSWLATKTVNMGQINLEGWLADGLGFLLSSTRLVFRQ